MSKRKWAFKLTDIQRAIKAVKQECLPVSGVRISADGTIVIDTRSPPDPPQSGKDSEVIL
jgi:hypothetical protein